MIEKEVEIVNRLGLHARAAAKLVNVSSAYACDVALVKDGAEVDGKSILGILLMAAAQGTVITIRCDGRDEAEALTAIASLIEAGFEEKS